MSQPEYTFLPLLEYTIANKHYKRKKHKQKQTNTKSNNKQKKQTKRQTKKKKKNETKQGKINVVKKIRQVNDKNKQKTMKV